MFAVARAIISAYDPFFGTGLDASAVGVLGEAEVGPGRLVPRYGTARAVLDVDIDGLITCFAARLVVPDAVPLDFFCPCSSLKSFVVGVGNVSSALRF